MLLNPQQTVQYKEGEGATKWWKYPNAICLSSLTENDDASYQNKFLSKLTLMKCRKDVILNAWQREQSKASFYWH